MKKFLFGVCVVLGLVGILTTQPLVTNVAGAQTPAVDAAVLQKHVKYLSVDVYPRSFDFPEHLNAAADYIKNDLTAAGIVVEEQKYVVQGVPYRSLIARFGPAEGEVLVMGAHYDSHGDAVGANSMGGVFKESYTPGADDNASGVAGLLELAKLLQKSPPPRPVELVFYTLEEPPYFRTENMGSAVHSRSLVESKRSVDMMISVEMIGYFTDAPDSQSFPLSVMKLVYPTQGNFIAVVGRYKDMVATRRVKSALKGVDGLPVRSINAPALVTGIDFSDHLNYWAQDFSAVMVTDTSFYRNHEYHRGGDTYERLNYPRMAQVVQGLYQLAQQP